MTEGIRENSPGRARKQSQKRSLMSGEARVRLDVDISSTVAAFAIDSIRDQHLGLSWSKLLELARDGSGRDKAADNTQPYGVFQISSISPQQVRMGLRDNRSKGRKLLRSAKEYH